jgi:hypothetical protein
VFSCKNREKPKIFVEKQAFAIDFTPVKVALYPTTGSPNPHEH